MATAPTYCTHRQLKDVFPQVDSFDSKRNLFNFTETDAGLGQAVDSYIHPNSGLVTALYRDSNDLGSGKQTIGTTKITDANELIDTTETSVTVISGAACADETYIKINDEIMYITNISGNNLTVVRGRLGTSASTHSDGSDVFQHFNPYADGQWLYDSDNDFLIMSAISTPSDNLMESGEDFSTLITRITANASRYLDAKLDPNLPKEQFKDKEGNYDYIIVRTTALLAATFLIRSHDPTSEVSNALMEDAQNNIDSLNKGGAALSWQTTGDSSKGIIRDVVYTSGKIRPVDTRGRWSGSWDLIKIKVIDGGVLGTATFSVFVKDGDSLKSRQVITAEKITGDYQHIANGLQIRFGGSTDTTEAAANDEWECEVAGWREEVDNSQVNSVSMTRGGLGMYRRVSKFGKY